MKREVLYYPSFVPPKQWLKDSLLYFDRVRSIIPSDQLDGNLTDDLKLLIDNDLYKPISQLDLLGDGNIYHKISEEFADRRRAMGMFEVFPLVHVSSMKFPENLRQQFRDEGFAYSADWFELPLPLANLYMSILASSIASHDWLSDLVPSTDRPEAILSGFSTVENRNFPNRISISKGGETITTQNSNDDDVRARRVGLVLENYFKHVRPDVTFDQLAKFRRDHHDELAAFRVLIDGQVKEISSATTDDQLRSALARISDQTVKEKASFNRIVDEVTDAHKQNLFKAILDWRSPATIGTVLGLAGFATVGPVSLAGAIAGVAATMYNVTVDYRRLENKRNADPLCYLYSARSEGILD